MAKKKYLEDFFLLVIAVIILAILVRILHASGVIMNVPLSVRTAGAVGFVLFSVLSVFSWRVLRKENWAIRFATMAVPCFAMMAIINDW